MSIIGPNPDTTYPIKDYCKLVFLKNFVKKNKIKYIYYHGHEICVSLLIYNFAKFPINSKVKIYLRNISSIKNLKVPKLPIFGKDIINLGIKSGPNVGKILGSIESWWVTNNFKPSRKKCLEKLKEFS